MSCPQERCAGEISSGISDTVYVLSSLSQKEKMSADCLGHMWTQVKDNLPSLWFEGKGIAITRTSKSIPLFRLISSEILYQEKFHLPCFKVSDHSPSEPRDGEGWDGLWVRLHFPLFSKLTKQLVYSLLIH